MAKRGKKYLEAAKKIEVGKRYPFSEAIGLLVAVKRAKFDETVAAAIRLGVNPAHADQMVRGSVVLPNGLGKSVRVLVFAKGEKEKEALESGADVGGSAEVSERIKGGGL